jgi:hypothetical protein
LYFTASIIRINKSGRKRWIRHVAHMRHIRNAYKILVSLKGKDQLGDIDIDGRIMLKLILRK